VLEVSSAHAEPNVRPDVGHDACKHAVARLLHGHAYRQRFDERRCLQSQERRNARRFQAEARRTRRARRAPVRRVSLGAHSATERERVELPYPLLVAVEWVEAQRQLTRGRKSLLELDVAPVISERCHLVSRLGGRFEIGAERELCACGETGNE
jgi:hypothetical protein